MTHETPAPKPHHFRLSDESWEEIGRAYMAGATARTLAQQWKVSPSTIYENAQRRGWSKRRDADAIVRRAQADAPAPAGRSGYFQLDDGAWEEIGAAFRAGATVDALAAQWQVSPQAVLLHMKKRGWSRGDRATPTQRALAAQEEPPEGMFAPDPRFWVERYTGGEIFDPAVAAQIATTAACGALAVGDLSNALVLSQIGYIQARILKLMPRTTREVVLEALSDRAACNEMFSRANRDGEEDLKTAYWDWRRAEDKRWSDLRGELAAAQARVAALEAALEQAGVLVGAELDRI